jgi:hypothetical protein
MTDGPFTIVASLWRDFMPGADDRLIVAVIVAATGTGGLPSRLRADRVDIRYADEAWVAHLVEEQPRDPAGSEFQAIARGGPRWPTDATVDVIVELVGPDGVARLRAPHQRIARVS